MPSGRLFILDVYLYFTVSIAYTLYIKTNFLPKGYVVFEKIYGDLNKDGLEDCVIIINGTDKSKFVKDEYRGELDRNRRGVSQYTFNTFIQKMKDNGFRIFERPRIFLSRAVIMEIT